jgi:hypothetical protein
MTRKNNSKNVNLQECLKILRDFQEAVSVDERNAEIKKIKEKAASALEHLDQLINKERPDNAFRCTPQRPKIYG